MISLSSVVEVVGVAHGSSLHLTRDDGPGDDVDQHLRPGNQDRRDGENTHQGDVPAEATGEGGADATDDAAGTGSTKFVHDSILLGRSARCEGASPRIAEAFR